MSSRPARTAVLLVPALLLGLGARAEPEAGEGAPADDAPEPTYTVDVRERRPVSAASAFVRDAKSFELRTLESPGDLLQVTPGLATAQHAGGGKANQYLVRGFDADHGTDLAISVDGVPVNMRSHAHGQGYADLHFLIPETVERVEITKGPYDATVGDFGTAGSVNLVTRERAEESFLRAELGELDTQRYVGLLSPRTGPFGGDDPRADALFALEAYGSDGPFANDEELWRYSGFGRLGVDLSEATRLESSLHFYDADWDASGQVPQRRVDAPGFDRWDSIDPTEGGKSSTARGLLRLEHEISERERIRADVWLLYYALDLYSNFTFFLDDPVFGDQIVQRDDRIAYGGALSWRRALDSAAGPLSLTAGLETRHDDAHVRLGESVERELRGYVTDHEILERSLAGYAEAELLPLPWVRTVLGLRAEHFWYDVSDETGDPGAIEGDERDAILLPKASLILSPFAADGPLPAETGALRELELFLNYGRGFHSNDARDAVANPREETLPAANGWEVGLRSRIGERLDVALVYWWLRLQSELVFVGDAGTTEPTPRSEREGVELSAELEILPWLFWRGDLGYSGAEYAGGGKVPQAIRLRSDTALVARHPSGFSAALRYAYQGERYATEEPEPRLRSYGVWDLVLRYRRGPLQVSLAVENLGNTEWESAEFYYASRLPGEPAAGFEDHHFVPGNPRNVRVGLSWYF